MILDTMVRAELIETSYLSIPIMLMAIGFSMGIGSNIFPYMAMSCTVFSLGFCYAFNWLFLIGYNLTFNVFIYHNFQETTIIEFLAVVCGIYTILLPWILYDYDQIFNTSSTKKTDEDLVDDEQQKLNHQKNTSYNSLEKFLSPNKQDDIQSKGSFYEKQKRLWDDELKRSSFSRQNDITLRSRFEDNTQLDEITDIDNS